MRALAKAALVAVPVLVVLLLLRSCREDEAGRWLGRLEDYDPTLRIAVDRPDLIVLAPDVGRGRTAGEHVARFRQALVTWFSDLVGKGGPQRTAVVLFSTLARLQAFHGRGQLVQTGDQVRPEGFTDPTTGAIFLPPESGDAVLRHETVHLVMAGSWGPFVEFSPWVKEGLAQFFERYDPDRGAAGPRPLDAPHRSWLREYLPDGRPDLDRLLALDDYARFTGPEAPRNYAEAHLLVCFLFECRPRESLARYIAAERQLGTPDRRRQAFADCFGEDTGRLEAEFGAWLSAP